MELYAIPPLCINLIDMHVYQFNIYACIVFSVSMTCLVFKTEGEYVQKRKCLKKLFSSSIHTFFFAPSVLSGRDHIDVEANLRQL